MDLNEKELVMLYNALIVFDKETGKAADVVGEMYSTQSGIYISLVSKRSEILNLREKVRNEMIILEQMND